LTGGRYSEVIVTSSLTVLFCKPIENLIKKNWKDLDETSEVKKKLSESYLFIELGCKLSESYLFIELGCHLRS